MVVVVVVKGQAVKSGSRKKDKSSCFRNTNIQSHAFKIIPTVLKSHTLQQPGFKTLYFTGYDIPKTGLILHLKRRYYHVIMHFQQQMAVTEIMK